MYSRIILLTFASSSKFQRDRVNKSRADSFYKHDGYILRMLEKTSLQVFEIYADLC